MNALPMDRTWCEEVIISTVKRKGGGLEECDPIRIITQVFKKDGTLIAEYDPIASGPLEFTFPVNFNWHEINAT